MEDSVCEKMPELNDRHATMQAQQVCTFVPTEQEHRQRVISLNLQFNHSLEQILHPHLRSTPLINNVNCRPIKSSLKICQLEKSFTYSHCFNPFCNSTVDINFILYQAD